MNAPASNPATDARSASGLVSFTPTSDTQAVKDVLVVEQDRARLSRMARRVVKAANVHTEANQLTPAMITLTYERVEDWQPRHVSEALKRVRHWMKRRGLRFRYVWTAELQQRGAVHYHVLAWFPSGKKKPPFWDLQGWWPHGITKCEWAYSPVGYMVKYVSKIGSKDRLPCGARMHGSGGFTVAERKLMSFHSKARWIQKLSYIGQKTERAKGGGIVQHFACGLRRHHQSPFIVVHRAFGRIVLARRHTERAPIVQAIEHLWETLSATPSKLKDLPPSSVSLAPCFS